MAEEKPKIPPKVVVEIQPIITQAPTDRVIVKGDKQIRGEK
jgi:hypothetical protein